ncbi:hypothetical protein PR048_013476 [Dryococelus australis]|uniref:Integrase catalytic domain-containing protein n=1 Tax=Dryococelus australis TaxID=614101 RepID=A0ABQ9HSG0_9NEOP|nr:hypothetical protein PR048_013476 [Dryococelus australis]
MGAEIKRLQNVFARYGIPETVCSDGGTQFTLWEFQKFAQACAFSHITSSPRFPQSNGAAKNAVVITKKILTKSQDPNLGLLTYQTTPLESGYSLAELLFGKTSGECGANVTMIATGNSIPLFVFRERTSNCSAEWCPMLKCRFRNSIIMHFVKHIWPIVDKPLFLFIDYHESHVIIQVIDFEKLSGVVLLIFYSCTCNKMQLLDRGVFGPFKTNYHEAMNNWMVSPGNIGKHVTLYEVVTMAGIAFCVFTLSERFKQLKIIIFILNIFTDIDYMATSVTDQSTSQDT